MATLLEKYLEVDQEIKILEARKKELREEIGELPLGGTAINDEYRFAVSETRRFKPALAKDLLSKDDFQRVLKPTVDLTLVKQVVAPEILDLMYVSSGQTWKIVKRDD